MPTLLTSAEIEMQILFTEPVPDVIEFVRELIIKRDPLVLTAGGAGGNHTTYVINLASLAQFTLTERAPGGPLDEDVATVLVSLAELRQ